MDPLPEVNETGTGKLDCLNDALAAVVVSEGGDIVDVPESKFGYYVDLQAAKVSELMKLGSLENVSTQSLFSAVNKTLHECVKTKKGDIPQCVASILQLMVQEIEHRFLNQAKSFKKQQTLYSSREEKYLLKIKACKTLVEGTNEENEIARNLLHQTKIENSKNEKTMKCQEQELTKLREELGHSKTQVLSLEEELKLAKMAYEENSHYLETKANESKENLLKKILELEVFLTDSRNKIKELQNFSESKVLKWKRKEQLYWQFIDSQCRSLQQLRMTSESMKQEVQKIKALYADEFYHFAMSLKVLTDAAHNYHTVLEENRKLYNEVQDLKGNIRVYCRIRPFLPAQIEKQTAIEYIGENGELVVMNSIKPGKDSHRLFKFNKVFGPASTQDEVFQDTQPLIRSVLDGYNVCIFAYGQTGSGKTYTMTGPNGKSTVDWGVNYRALNDLFNISQSRSSSITYEIGVQMIEIYNEQVRDLLRNDSLAKRFGIWNASLPNGLAVPDASMHPVKSITNVLELMNVGLMNRAVGATALNERSSRSHSILTVHVRGIDLETNTVLHGCLHLVDLAGSERVDRSEATGDRLREAQNINKSLSALGDVIFALAQKNPHVPYRNSKLTQVLQSSLGGQAKTLMFVQLNPDVESYSETISTLKFAERVSGVELGAARSNKEGKGVRELVEQVASLKKALAQKEEEIGMLRLLNSNADQEEHSTGSSQQGPFPGIKNSSDGSDEAGSLQSIDEFGPQAEIFQQIRREKFSKDSRLALGLDFTNGGKNLNNETSISGFPNANACMKLGDESIGTETICSSAGIQNSSHFTDIVKLSTDATEKLNVPRKLPEPPIKQGNAGLFQSSHSTSKVPCTKRTTIGSSSGVKHPKRRP